MPSSNSDGAEGGDFYGFVRYKAREGRFARRAAAGESNSDEFQLQIDDLEKGDLDTGITGLRKRARQLNNVSLEIESEAKIHTCINQLQVTLIKARAGLKNNMTRMNQRIVQEASNHVKEVVVFVLVCFFVVYLWFRFVK